MKIVIAGGHLTPAMAVISQLKKVDHRIDFYFFGRKFAVEGDKTNTSFEYQEIRQARIPFFEIPSGRIQRRFTKYTFSSLIKTFPGLLKSLILLAKIRPRLVLTFGGYLSLPVAVAAVILRIPVVAHEQTPKLGLANEIIFRLARLKAVSDKTLAEKLQKTGVLFTGPLLRGDIFSKTAKSSQIAEFLEKTGNAKLIYITGGATGSHLLNQVLEVTIEKILKGSFVIHQTGNLANSGDFLKLKNIKRNLPKNLSEKYFLTEFIKSADSGAVLSRADLVISRSGANTTAELRALGKVAIIVPLEWGKEQKLIAENFCKTGAGLIISQNELTKERFLENINLIFKNFQKFGQSAQLLARKSKLDGTRLFAKDILKIVQNG